MDSLLLQTVENIVEQCEIKWMTLTLSSMMCLRRSQVLASTVETKQLLRCTV